MESSEIQIDARGTKCPRPIIELAKARRQLDAGATIVILADDVAFESDVKAWCETTGNALDSFSSDGVFHTARIRIT